MPEVPDRAPVFVGSLVANPLVAGRERSADLLGRVVRGIVGDDQLEFAVILAEDRLDRLGEVTLAIVDRQSNADEGLPASVATGFRFGGGQWMLLRILRPCWRSA